MKFLTKVFVQRPGEHCGWFILKMPFKKKYHGYGEWQPIYFIILQNLLPIFIEQGNVSTIHEAINRLKIHEEQEEPDPYQRKYWFNLLDKLKAARKFAND